MIVSTAQLRFYRQSAKKVRQLADVIRNLSVNDAKSQLVYQPKHASDALLKLLNSALANARQTQGFTEHDVNRLFIKEITVNEGPTFKRFTPKAQGRATMVRKRTSHIKIVLGKRKNKVKSINKLVKKDK